MFDLDGELKMMRKAMRVADLAELLNVSQGQIYKLVDQGVLPAFRLGSSIRFDPQVVATWIRDQAATI